tara:strand:+ start:2627 stop:3340 length:714 start_codon:yes stop_codon:yes gene_type:complete
LKQKELIKAFELYDTENNKNVNNTLDQNYIKLVKFIHEELNIPIDELKIYVDNFVKNYVTNIIDEFENIMISRNTFEYSQNEIIVETTNNVLIYYLFEKGITRLQMFDYSLSNNIIKDFVKIHHNSTKIYHIYVAVLLVTLQVFSNGNHRTSYFYLKNKIYVNKTEYMKMVEKFRREFNDYDYTNLDEEYIGIFLEDFLNSLKPYINKATKLTQGGEKSVSKKKRKRKKKKTKKCKL